MSNEKEFEELKQRLLDENEQRYSDELRDRYGDTVDLTNDRFKNMTKAQYDESLRLSLMLNEALVAATKSGDPSGQQAQYACDLHRQWLCIFWTEDMYTKQSHMALAQMYCDDERFKAYYEAIVPGGAEFLRNAMLIYTKE